MPDKPIAVRFEMDERSYLHYQRLLKKGYVKGAGEPLAIGLSDEKGFSHRGTLDHFADKFEANTGTIRVYGVLPNPDGLLLPGMFVRVRMTFGLQPNVSAPPEMKELSPPAELAEIKTLLKDRRDILDKVVDFRTKEYKAGNVPFSVVAQAERDALRATLDLDEGPEKRTATLEKLQKNAESTVKIAEAYVKAGQGSEVDLLQAKAFELEVRLELLRNEQKAKSRK
jgi:hypothetical protein